MAITSVCRAGTPFATGTSEIRRAGPAMEHPLGGADAQDGLTRHDTP
ncbi:hypothetical protein QF038_003514 [Pseudarthrobacter sp. W1I19]|nr:hypothetical protein [Pseudarthrobacter sp. W1I19]MDQ0925006.1 hypothetical protein [Pseudarthrobacter sp. W1I19]